MPAEPDFNHAARRAVEHAREPRTAPIESRVAVIASLSGLRGLLMLIAAAIVIGGWVTTPAVAHGPCRCLDPRLAEADSPVRIGFEIEVGQTTGRGYPAYRVVFNPHPSDLGIAPRLLGSAYRADVATTTVLSRPRNRPTRRARFRVPAGTPPGVYLVLIFDGNEGRLPQHLGIPARHRRGPRNSRRHRATANACRPRRHRLDATRPILPLVCRVAGRCGVIRAGPHRRKHKAAPTAAPSPHLAALRRRTRHAAVHTPAALPARRSRTGSIDRSSHRVKLQRDVWMTRDCRSSLQAAAPLRVFPCSPSLPLVVRWGRGCAAFIAL